MKEVIELLISTAWNKEIVSDIILQTKYKNLFEMRTPYQSSILDGIELLSSKPLTADFIKLIKSKGRHHYLSFENPYKESYSLGCVTLLVGPKFRTVPPYKIKINPSEGGLSAQQVINWARYAIGNENDVLVKRADFKIDVKNLNPVHYMKRIWTPRIRKIDDQYTNQTLYLGSRNSSRTIIVYDKATQNKKYKKVTSNWTRIEVREKYSKHKQMTLHDFLNSIISFTPFDDLIIVDADTTELNQLLKRYKKIVVEDSVIKTFKQLSTYQRNSVMKKLQLAGKLKYLSQQYINQLNTWLKY